MKVECIKNLCKEIPAKIYEGLQGYSVDSRFDIEVGQKSIVYGITIIKKHLWYLINIDNLPYLIYYPSALFKIIDSRLSRYWHVAESRDDEDSGAIIIKFGFKELVEDEFFYGEYLEDYPKNVEIFQKYIELMKKEYD